MRYSSTAVLVLAATSALAQDRSAQSPPILDFMIMNVCVDSQDRPLAGIFPGNASCTRQRDIRAGEVSPYSLHNHVGLGKGCDARLGNVAKENLPVVINKVTRIISSYDKGRAPECGKEGVASQRFGDFDAQQEGASIQWVDNQYAFILGSWSPVTEAHWVTPLCRNHLNDSRRFFRGWIIGSADGKAGYVTAESKLVLSTPKDGVGACPSRFNRSFTYWFPSEMKFTNGMSLGAIVSSHYSRASVSGLSPGKAEQVERTYWTREFGFVRWEKWARKDWIHPRNKKPATDMASNLRNSGRCSPPATLPVRVNGEFEVRSVRSNQDIYLEQQRIEKGDFEDWVMTACNDFSKPVARPNGQAAVDWGTTLNRAYWRE
ncbi:hypothetical protein [Polaromonas sp. JS666]|uniref:hypothetical protein n=1 Tax=Polaromonas sp. (strain JS666 / ATCC BAA-500) TaxID=296591 RepID=UPI0002D30080|nr:hypothetical protein [Polaromonas sp. JS666]